MSYKLMQNIKEELDRIAEKGLNTSNLETAYKLIDMFHSSLKKVIKLLFYNLGLNMS